MRLSLNVDGDYTLAGRNVGPRPESFDVGVFYILDFSKKTPPKNTSNKPKTNWIMQRRRKHIFFAMALNGARTPITKA